MSSRGFRKQLVPYLLLLPSALVVFPLLIYPLIQNVILSFFSYNVVFPRFKYVGSANYSKLLGDKVFQLSVLITLVYTGVSVLAEFVVGMGMALMLNARIALKRAYRLLALSPYLSPPAVVALIWRLLWDPDLGPINLVLRSFGIDGPAWIAQRSTALFSVIFTTVWRDMPFVALVVLAGLQSLPQEPFDAAEVDGATRLQIFRLITLPMLRPVISIILLFQTIFTLRLFDIIWVLTEGGPAGVTMTQSIMIYKTLFRFFDGGQSSAMSVVLLSITGLLSIAYFRVLSKEIQL
jgi:multiple sugar transport system permease protein